MVASRTGSYKKPLPVIHPDNAPYWAALKNHELRLQRCTDCNTLRYPVSPVCWKCLSEAADWEKLSGKGTLRSWIVVEAATGNPAWSEDIPYVVALVDLAEGPRLTTNVVETDPYSLTYGMPLEIVFADVTDEVTLAKFKPAS
ncbi:MAG: OB-fold domain-containing protein [Chloroflexota bacterium]